MHFVCVKIGPNVCYDSCFDKLEIIFFVNNTDYPDLHLFPAAVAPWTLK